MTYPNPHPDLMALARLGPCRSLDCTEVIGGPDTPEFMVVLDGVGVRGFCRDCYQRLTLSERA